MFWSIISKWSLSNANGWLFLSLLCYFIVLFSPSFFWVPCFNKVLQGSITDYFLKMKSWIGTKITSHNPSLERAWRWRLWLQSELLFWELESRWTPDPSKSDCRGQNTSHWGFLYIIEKILKCKYLKWAHMTHLNICNISYGKKKGQELNCQFDSRPQKVRNRPDHCVCRWRATHCWKAFDESYNFASDLFPIGDLSAEL